MRGTCALLLALLLSACGGGGDPERQSRASRSPAAPVHALARAPWGESGTTHLRRLGNAEIVAALAGRSIAYAPPGWADAGGYEEFSAGGFWRGTHLGRGPMHFSGRWKVDGGRLCVTARRIRPNHRWGHGPVCRAVWRDRRNAGLLTEHFAIGTPGLLRLQLGPVRNPSS